MGWHWVTGFMPYGDAWRRRRRLLHNYLHRTSIHNHHAIQETATRILPRDIHEDPKDFLEHLRKHSGAIILKAMYGYDVQGKDDPLVRLADTGISYIEEATKGGVFLVDIFPLLRYIPMWLPGANFRRMGAKAKILSTRMLNEPFEDARLRMAKKTALPCLVTKYMTQLDDQEGISESRRQFQEDVIKEAAGVGYAAGADTTASSIATFILAMLHYPEVQKNAQAELDTVVGRDRLPTFEDKCDLPYIQCIARETMR